LAGPAVALVLHPYFPNNLGILRDQLAGVARHVWLTPAQIPRELFGEELGGLFSQAFLSWAPAYLPVAFGLVTFLASRRQRLSTDGLALTLMAGALLVAGLLSYRFMDFFLPVAVLLGARLWSELMAGASLGELAQHDSRAFWAAAVPLSLCLVAGMARYPVLAVRSTMAGQVTEVQRQRPSVRFLHTVAVPGDIVYHSFWFDFSALYHFRPDGRYVEALDPIFFYRRDPRLFAAALALTRNPAADAYGVIKNDFKARWVYLSRYADFPPATAAISGDVRFKKVYQDDHALIFRVD
jgi:hypothetical protein